jgi:4-amino-4-deoxy-L-arabinose transferase-like glycosyltransferase
VNRKQVYWVTGICLLTAVLRLAGFFVLDRFANPDLWESETIAINLLKGKGYVFPFFGIEYFSYVEPVYPYLCAAIYALTNHSWLALGMVHVFLGTLLVWLVFTCGRHVASTNAAIVAALIAAIHPGLIFYTTKFHNFVIDSVLFLAVLAAVLKFSPRRVWRSLIGLGVLIGITVLTRPTILVCLPMICWWIWRQLSGAWPTRSHKIGVLIISLIVTVSPWVIRNYLIHDQFVLTRSGSPMVFWLGNNPYQFTGSALTPSGDGLFDESIPIPMRERLFELDDEIEQQALFMEDAVRFVKAHPILFLKRWIVKFWYFWWRSPQAGLFSPKIEYWVYQGYYLVMALFALLSLGVYSKSRENPRRQAAFFIATCCLMIAALQSVYYIEGRHRLAIEPYILILSGHGIYWMISRLSKTEFVTSWHTKS